MTHPSSPADYRGLQFGPFVVDAGRRLLWRDGRLVPLTPRALDILLLLIDHRGEVVDKDTLLAAIWGSTVVEEATVVRHVSTLRKALHLRPDQHDVLVTLSGRGYRFVAPVTELEHLPVALPTGPAPQGGASPWSRTSEPRIEAPLPASRPPRAGRRVRVGAWVAGVAAVFAAGAIVLGPAAGSRFSTAPPRCPGRNRWTCVRSRSNPASPGIPPGRPTGGPSPLRRTAPAIRTSGSRVWGSQPRSPHVCARA